MSLEKTFRQAIDITPHCKKGNSFWGLKRSQAKKLGMFFLGLGFLISLPPIIPSPDDVINIILAKGLSNIFGLSPVMALAFTYTLIGWGLIYLGLVIYPAHTQSLLNGYVNKVQKKVRKIKKNPLLVMGLIIGGILVFKWYTKILL